MLTNITELADDARFMETVAGGANGPAAKAEKKENELEELLSLEKFVKKRSKLSIKDVVNLYLDKCMEQMKSGISNIFTGIRVDERYTPTQLQCQLAEALKAQSKARAAHYWTVKMVDDNGQVNPKTHNTLGIPILSRKWLTLFRNGVQSGVGNDEFDKYLSNISSKADRMQFGNDGSEVDAARRRAAKEWETERLLRKAAREARRSNPAPALPAEKPSLPLQETVRVEAPVKVNVLENWDDDLDWAIHANLFFFILTFHSHFSFSLFILTFHSHFSFSLFILTFHSNIDKDKRNLSLLFRTAVRRRPTCKTSRLSILRQN